MLDKNDISLLRGMFREEMRENNEILRKEMREGNQALRDELRGEMRQNTVNLRDEIHAAVNASEKRITTNIAELLDTSVLPQIADLQRDMTLVKRHLQLI